MADVLEFDVLLPIHGFNEDTFHENCESFLRSAMWLAPLPDGSEIEDSATTMEAESTLASQDPFYLRCQKIGSGTYGDVF